MTDEKKPFFYTLPMTSRERDEFLQRIKEGGVKWAFKMFPESRISELRKHALEARPASSYVMGIMKEGLSRHELSDEEVRRIMERERDFAMLRYNVSDNFRKCALDIFGLLAEFAVAPKRWRDVFVRLIDDCYYLIEETISVKGTPAHATYLLLTSYLMSVASTQIVLEYFSAVGKDIIKS